MRILGIDPGKTGCVALLDTEDDSIITCEPPLITIKKKSRKTGKVSRKTRYDVEEMVDLICSLTPIDYAVIEKQHAMRKAQDGRVQGVVSTASIVRGYTLWEAIVAAHRIPYSTPVARTWQKIMHTGIDGENTKEKSIKAAQLFFPGIDLRRTEKCKVPHDGKADAILIALYGKTVYSVTLGDVA